MAKAKTPKLIKILVVPVGKKPVVREIATGLAAMQTIVGGYIQMVPIAKGIDLVCDEEGLMKGYPFNRAENLVNGGCIVGNFFITRTNASGGAQSLSPKDIKTYMERYT
jgi:hypothetical protein